METQPSQVNVHIVGQHVAIVDSTYHSLHPSLLSLSLSLPLCVCVCVCVCVGVCVCVRVQPLHALFWEVGSQSTVVHLLDMWLSVLILN